MDSTSLISGLTLRLLVVGIPKHSINPFAGMITKWVTCSGELWTIERLKSLKTTLISLRSGSDTTIPFAKNRRGQIKGTIGRIE